MTIYAIGDIHGHLGLLHAAHARIEADRARHGTGDAPVIHIGDLVDRGPNSAGVVDYLSRETAHDPRLIVLKGNHDLMFEQWLATGPGRHPDAPKRPPFLHDRVGGRSTLASYGVSRELREAAAHAEAIARVPEAHRRFLAGLPLMHPAGDCVFVHAGIRPGVALEDQSPNDLLWIRDPFLYDLTDHGPLIVHGHTPVEAVTHHGNRVAIDTGAAYGGPLSAVAIEGRDVFVLTREGRRAVRPE